jgi:hypothetical protein
MFVPPYETLLRTMGLTREQADKSGEVTISAKAFRLLVQAAVSGSDFNETGYLVANPDIADALNKKLISSASDHYINYGYFEGRAGATKVDESWYLRLNPDVASAVRIKKVGSASEHYIAAGAAEYRAPNEISAPECARWKLIARR